MALVIALLAAGVWSLSSASSVEIDAWQCGDTPEVEQSLTAIERANCRPADVDAVIEVVVDDQLVQGMRGTDPAFVPGELEEPAEAVLRVTLDNPSSGLVVADTRAAASVPGHALRGDADGLVWETSYTPGNTTELVVLVGPEPANESLN